MFRVSYQGRATNARVSEMVGESRKLLKDIQIGRLRYLALLFELAENRVCCQKKKIERGRLRETQRRMCMSYVTKILDMKFSDYAPSAEP